MGDDNFLDFAAFWEFFNPFEDEDAPECPECGKEFSRGDKIEVVHKEGRTFRCPDCGVLLQLDTATGELEEVEEGEKGVSLGEEISKKVNFHINSFPVGQLKSQEKFVCPIASGNVTFYLDLFTLDLKSRNKIEVLNELVSMFTASGLVKEGKEYYKNLISSEGISSTGIGEGVAFPHASSDVEDDMIAGVAISKEGVNFDSLDGKSVHIIFVSAFNRKSVTELRIRLKFLAQASRFLRFPEIRQALINAKSREELLQFIKDNFVLYGTKEY